MDASFIHMLPAQCCPCPLHFCNLLPIHLLTAVAIPQRPPDHPGKQSHFSPEIFGMGFALFTGKHNVVRDNPADKDQKEMRNQTWARSKQCLLAPA
ncbi:hypothetical protein [Flavonifractor plautii]|uniref:hypothetical protein n=1 Tax=Flavonifractor plautii TaxID=292800 RepID=UPI00195E357B|nr:hypothetical protein [Flavonifractor plautii]MBM6663533.1 hypothetical protein [Flavonifractor plautii]